VLQTDAVKVKKSRASLHDGVHGKASMPRAGWAFLDGFNYAVQLGMAHLGGHVVAAHVVGEGAWAEV